SVETLNASYTSFLIEHGSLARRARTSLDPVRQILVVEDDPSIRQSIKQVFEAGNYPVILLEARSGMEALEKLEMEQPDVVLLDITMPSESGDELLKALRETSNSRDLPLILFSTRELDKDENQKG